MTFILPALLVVIFIAVAISLYTEGLWGNSLRLINTVTAALLATNFYEPLAGWLEGMMPSYKYFCDFISLWLLFAISMGVLRAATDFVSKVKVRFLKIVDQIGSGVLACCVAAVMVSFVTMTLHTAPLAEKFLKGGFQSDKKMMAGLAPDRKWLGFSQTVSRGSFSRSSPKPLNPQHFRDSYKQRRAEIESHANSAGSVSTN